VKQIPNSIGYVEYAYVVQNHMTYAVLQNSGGNFIAPNADSFQAAAAGADWKNAKDFFLVMTNAPGAQAYPITATTFILMRKQPQDKGRSDEALKFFRWALQKGQPQAQKLDYVPLPSDLSAQIESYIGASIK
jgi:phosphate transport system substrate-binding protein